MEPSESDLISKLERIQALYTGATTAGERHAAAEAIKRVTARLAGIEVEDPPVEYRFSMHDEWSRKLFLALVRQHGLQPYRYGRQRHTTVMVLVSKGFVDEVLWPQFEALDRELRRYLAEVTERVVRAALQGDTTEAAEREQALLASK